MPTTLLFDPHIFGRAAPLPIKLRGRNIGIILAFVIFLSQIPNSRELCSDNLGPEPHILQANLLS